MSERALLLQLVEAAAGVEPDWQDALRRAGYRGRHFPGPFNRRRLIALAAAALAAAVVVSSVAADRPLGFVYRLVDRSDETFPVRQVPVHGGWVRRPRSDVGFMRSEKELACVERLREIDLGPRAELKCMDRVPGVRAIPVLEGSIAGRRFVLSTWLDPDLNMGFDAGAPAEPAYGTNVPSVGDGWGGAAIRGLPLPSWADPVDEDSLHWVSFAVSYTSEGPITSAGVGHGPKWISGVANPQVARVDLENTNDGTVVSVPTIAPPEGFPLRVRYWVAALRLDQLVHVIVPRNSGDDELERWEMNQAL
jgi:hypothetical protein